VLDVSRDMDANRSVWWANAAPLAPRPALRGDITSLMWR
jgi:hypothetical protein